MIEKIEQIIPKEGANVGTNRGERLIKRSMERFGAGRGVVVDRNGNVICGSKVVEQAKAAGMKIKVVNSDGTQLIAGRRNDLKLGDATADALGVVDNRASEVGLAWDTTVLAAAAGDFGADAIGFNIDDFNSSLDSEIKPVKEAKVVVVILLDLRIPIEKDVFATMVENVSQTSGTGVEDIAAEFARRLGIL